MEVVGPHQDVHRGRAGENLRPLKLGHAPPYRYLEGWVLVLETPVAANRVEELLRRSVKPGDRVLDTFGGTGTLIPAAHSLKCRATVIEQNPTYYGLCLERLKGLDAQQEMPV